MPVLTVNGKTSEVSRGVRLSEAIGHEHALAQPCAGLGRCGKCRVMVHGEISPPCDQEKKLLTQAELDAGVRLACRTFVLGDCTVTLEEQGSMEIRLEGNRTATAAHPSFSKLGAAVDLGTTTLAARLYDAGGTVLAQAGAPNPQERWGADVISRIQASMNGARLELAQSIQQAIRDLLNTLAETAGQDVASIDGVVIAGNTAMLYLLTAMPPDALSRAPFEADRLYGETLSAGEIGLSDCPDAQVYLPRCMSAFVGADITAALLASGICENTQTSMLVDIGTNGEMAVWHSGELRCCSTAAGPAFEGAGLSMGMTGAAGAIDHIRLENGSLHAHVIGGGEARGICGSGVVDALACLLETEQLDETGLLEEDPTVLMDAVSLSQKDIRMVQLAKSAICAGLNTLLDTAGLSWDEVSGLSVAGGFGSYLNLENAGKIGLLPEEILPRVCVIGNASLDGAALLLLDETLRAKSEQMAQRAHTVELHANPVFADYYMEGMLF